MKCPGCGTRIVRPVVMCRPCWLQVDPLTRERVAVAWRPGPPNDDFVAELMAAAKTVKVAE